MRVDDATQREAVGSWTGERRVGGWSPGETVGGRRPREAVGSWTGEKELVAGPENESWWLDPRVRVGDATQREAVGSWTGERRVGGWRAERQAAEGVAAGQERGEQQKLAWKNGGAVNTRHRAERRGDKIGSSEEESQDV